MLKMPLPVKSFLNNCRLKIIAVRMLLTGFCLYAFSCAGNSPNTHLTQKFAAKAVQTDNKSRTEPELQSYFSELAFGSEYGFGSGTVKKWTQNILLEVHGQPSAADLQELVRVVEDLNRLLQPALQISLVENGGNAQIHFITHDAFYAFEPPGIVFYGGFFRNWWNTKGEIYRGVTVIGTDRIDPALRAHLIREEVTQMLGLMNDSMKYENSIFYQGKSLTREYAAIDRAVIRQFYHPAVRPGMTETEVRQVFKRYFETGSQPTNRLSAF